MGVSARWFAMTRFCIGLVAFLLPTVSAADGTRTDEDRSDCGGDAYSVAEVVPPQRGARRRWPIMVVPDTLCADLASSPARKIESLNIYVDRRGEGTGQRLEPGRVRPPMAPHRAY